MNMQHSFSIIQGWLTFGVLFIVLQTVYAQQLHQYDLDRSQDEVDLQTAYGDEELISIATGNQQPLYLAPAVTSMITAAEIKKMGAIDLSEVLESVPGLHVSRTTSPYNPIFQIRGITSGFNPQVLVLINGIPITNVFTGNRGQVWTGMPVQNIARIEVIRGPGSALHGADAFAGVINVITKTANDVRGLQSGIRTGSFNSQEGWLIFGRDWGKFNIAFSFQYSENDGHDERIDADAQTFFDSMLGSTASLAPGSVNVGHKRLDTRLDVGAGNWRFRFGYQERSDVGTGVGTAEALDPVGGGDSNFFNADLTYKNSDWFEDWELETQFSFLDTSNRSDLVLFPPGAVFPDGEFPDGVLGNPDVYERHYRVDLSILYTGFDDHRIRTGAGFRLEDLYKVEESKNFTSNQFTGLPIPRDQLVNVSDLEAFVKETDRKIVYFFVQDEWDFLSDWTLTAGVRFDHYSDFGSTINPRFALVWQTAYNLTSKLMYGRAFRAPSFQEQFNQNNPVALGNDDLDPETIDSIELAFDYLPQEDLRTKLNLFVYQMDDILRFVPMPPSAVNLADNTGRQTGYGLEFEATWDTTDSVSLYGNYAYQKSRDDRENEDVGFAPTHQVYGRVDWQFLPAWNFDVQTNWVFDRKRSPGDSRPKTDDYVTVDLTLRGKVPDDRWELAFSVRNLFDEDAREPSLPAPIPAGSFIPGDLPLTERSVYLELRYNLN